MLEQIRRGRGSQSVHPASLPHPTGPYCDLAQTALVTSALVVYETASG